MGRDDPRDGELAAKSQINFEEAHKHWAYQPVVQPKLPAVKQSDWPTNAIDQFALAKMEEHGLHPVDGAAKRELIRRATFDLTGLPPKPEHVAEFLHDDSATAFEAVVDRLLKSPHYGDDGADTGWMWRVIRKTRHIRFLSRRTQTAFVTETGL